MKYRIYRKKSSGFSCTRFRFGFFSWFPWRWVSVLIVHLECTFLVSWIRSYLYMSNSADTKEGHFPFDNISNLERASPRNPNVFISFKSSTFDILLVVCLAQTKARSSG